jgi:hypothetical protein
MHGTIAKKGKRWYAVVYDGIDEATGRQKRRWVRGGDRKADAERVLADLIRRKYDGEPVISYKGTLGEYLTERWLPVQESRVRPSTFDSYRRNIDTQPTRPRPKPPSLDETRGASLGALRT